MPVRGAQRIHFRDYNIFLTLIFQDVDKAIASIKASDTKFDAWFLDGFSPNKNPKMWTEKVFKVLSEKSHENTTYATFSSSGLVKKNLLSVNASLNISKGFAAKRHMTKGSFKSDQKKLESKVKTVAIIGAGISGCTLAHSLSERGHKSLIFDKEDDICKGSSGNSALMLYPRISAFNSPFSRFAIQSFIFSSHLFEDLKVNGWNKTGVILLDNNKFAKKRIKELRSLENYSELYRHISAEEASKISKTKLYNEGLFFPSAGWIDPYKVCKELASNSNTKILTNEEVLEISKTKEKISVKTDKDIYLVDDICLCNSTAVDTLYETKGIITKRGQTTLIESEDSIKDLSTPICGSGYISPKINGLHILGSTYSKNTNLTPSVEDNLKNLGIHNEIFFSECSKSRIKGSEVGFRATTLDFLPIAGKNSKFYFNIGHGSKGSTSAPLCSEYIADLINGSPISIDSEVVESLSWERFNSENSSS